MSVAAACSRMSHPKSILKPAYCPHKPSPHRSVSFSSDPSVRMADSYDRSPASPITELSWSDIEELRRLQMDCDDDELDRLDEAKAMMDLPALLAAAPTALLPLLPPISQITRPVPTLTLPSPRNKGCSHKRPAPPPAPMTRKRPLLAFLPLLPVSDGPASPSSTAPRSADHQPFFAGRSYSPDDVDMSPSTDSSDAASPLTPTDARTDMEFSVTFKRRMLENEW